jgi:hypothetical protein
MGIDSDIGCTAVSALVKPKSLPVSVCKNFFCHPFKVEKKKNLSTGLLGKKTDIFFHRGGRI